MLLYLLRHAIAVPADVRRFSDYDRPLTARGIKRMQEAAKGISKLIDRPNKILTSPLKRALETTQIVAKQFELEEQIEVTDLLIPHALPVELRKHLASMKELSSVLLVSHEPLLSEFAAFLMDSRGPNLHFRKGALACIEISHSRAFERGQLQWLIQPKTLRMI